MTQGWGVNTVARRLRAMCAVVIAGVVGAIPNVSESGEPPSQPSAVAPPQTGAQSAAVAPADPSTTRPATADPSSSAKKSVRKVLVDDTVTDAQLKQILAKGYKPETQARGNEVYYCRSEPVLGSRFETKVCRTAVRILQDEQQGKEATTNVERTGGNPAGK
jgi:hypothetical protein